MYMILYGWLPAYCPWLFLGTWESIHLHVQSLDHAYSVISDHVLASFVGGVLRHRSLLPTIPSTAGHVEALLMNEINVTIILKMFYSGGNSPTPKLEISPQTHMFGGSFSIPLDKMLDVLQHFLVCIFIWTLTASAAYYNSLPQLTCAYMMSHSVMVLVESSK